jgi:hypothetical protein
MGRSSMNISPLADELFSFICNPKNACIGVEEIQQIIDRHPINPAQLLGQLAKGRKKVVSKAESARRRQSLAKARAARWPEKE